ncbi:MAG: response regulator transcription factor [Bacteroidia bacterium]
MKKILVIEDNLSIMENLVEFLQLAGFNVLAANCGIVGLELARKFQPDLIICDILMPGMNGYEVLTELSHFKKCETPFIFSSSKAEPSDKTEGLALGAYDFIVKPYYMEELMEKINSCLQMNTGNSQQNFCA